MQVKLETMSAVSLLFASQLSIFIASAAARLPVNM